MPIASFVLENLSGETIFLLVEAKNGAVIKFFLYDSRPEERGDGSALYELPDDNAATIVNKGYSSYEMYNSTGEELDVKTIKHGDSLHFTLLKMRN